MKPSQMPVGAHKRECDHALKKGAATTYPPDLEAAARAMHEAEFGRVLNWSELEHSAKNSYIRAFAAGLRALLSISNAPEVRLVTVVGDDLDAWWCENSGTEHQAFAEVALPTMVQYLTTEQTG